MLPRRAARAIIVHETETRTEMAKVRRHDKEVSRVGKVWRQDLGIRRLEFVVELANENRHNGEFATADARGKGEYKK